MHTCTHPNHGPPAHTHTHTHTRMHTHTHLHTHTHASTHTPFLAHVPVARHQAVGGARAQAGRATASAALALALPCSATAPLLWLVLHRAHHRRDAGREVTRACKAENCGGHHGVGGGSWAGHKRVGSWARAILWPGAPCLPHPPTAPAPHLRWMRTEDCAPIRAYQVFLRPMVTAPSAAAVVQSLPRPRAPDCCQPCARDGVLCTWIPKTLSASQI